jgi:hypothetical protein
LRLILALFLGLVVVGGRCLAADEAVWQPLAALDPGDKALAEAVMKPELGDDPALWPDWLDLRAALIPSGQGGEVMVVRTPWHRPCGWYKFTVLSEVTPDRTRARLGGDFCAGRVDVVPLPGRKRPDLVFSEGRQQDEASGDWHRVDQRVRWSGDQWLLIER